MSSTSNPKNLKNPRITSNQGLRINTNKAQGLQEPYAVDRGTATTKSAAREQRVSSTKNRDNKNLIHIATNMKNAITPGSVIGGQNALLQI